MGITRPTGEQLRFRSATTGDHILDTYMENSEKGSRTLPDLMDDLFDSSGVFRAANFEFRFDATADKIQFRAGNFANSNTGWTDITTFFDITGTFSASTTYNNFDLLTLTNKDVYIVHGLSSGTPFADEAAVIASANTEKLVDVSEARDWASKTNGQVVSTDYSSKAYAVGGTGIDTTTGSAKDWAIKTSSTVGNTSEYSAKYWATSTAVTTVSSGIANINTVAAAIANVNTTATNISNVNTVAGISADVTSVANIDGNVTTVAGISANTTTVAGIAPNVTTVAGISANVTTVAGIASNVTTVANNNTDISTVATNVADLQTVADEIDNNNLQTVANDIAAVITAADDLNESTSEIEVVANAITNVDLVGGSIANVNTVATNIANVNTTATNIANVNTVGGISANVTTVAGISANVTTAATNNANITTVAGISGNVTTVAGISANVTTVAGISADVTTAATNVTAFNNTYLGAQSSAPTQDPDGSALDLGDLYFDTSTNTMKVYAQSGWTAAGSSVNGTADRFNYTATAGQTTFTGADANGNSLAYDSGYADIYMNGVKLAPADYTATNGTSIVLASGAALNDTLEIIAYGTFTLSTHYTQTQSDARYVNVAGDTVTGNLSMGDNVKAIFGAELEIYSDATHARIREYGSGQLKIQGDNMQLLTSDGASTYLEGNASTSAVTLYHASNSPRLATTSTGVDITGRAVTDGVTVDGYLDFQTDGTFPTTGLVLHTNNYFYMRGGSLGTIFGDPSGNEYLRFTDSAVIFNNEGSDRDFRVESDSNSHMLFVDASLDHVLFGTSSGDIGGSVDGFRINAEGNALSGISETGTFTYNYYGDRRGSNNEGIVYGLAMNGFFKSSISVLGQSNSSDNGGITLDTISGNNTKTERMRITPTEAVFNINRGLTDFRVASGANNHMLFVDASTDQVVIGSSVGSGVSGLANGFLAMNQGNTSKNGIVIYNQGENYTAYTCKASNNTGDRYFGYWVNSSASNVGSIKYTSTGSTFNTTSDARLKENIQPIADATDKLMSMKPVTHTWIADPEAPSVHGFIAQEMQEVVPEAVSGEDGGEEMMSMDYGRITPVLVAALQDAHNKIEALEARINEMEAK